MQTTKTFKAKIVGKYIKKRWLFGDKPMIAVEILENVEPKFADFPTNTMAEHFNCNIGDTIGITMYQHANSLWYHYPESD